AHSDSDPGTGRPHILPRLIICARSVSPDYDAPMFTGLIEETGSVLWIRATDRGTQLQLSAPRIAGEVHTGDSIAVNGCCLTVASHRHQQVTFDLLEETVARTNLGALKPDSVVNLERALEDQ